MITAPPSGARVLIAEDHRDTALLLSQLLSVAGFHPASASDTSVITDVVLHEDVAVVLASYSGRGIAATTDLVGALRSRPEPALSGVGVVALVDHESDARFGLGASADAVLVRPVDVTQLADALTDVAATRVAARTARRAAGATERP
ncbi:MAG: hypothetical protein M3Y51_01970 [Actinomycetota bacterium]|nr:hypothetical protein [Actinomycetota bacterium]